MSPEFAEFDYFILQFATFLASIRSHLHTLQYKDYNVESVLFTRQNLYLYDKHILMLYKLLIIFKRQNHIRYKERINYYNSHSVRIWPSPLACLGQADDIPGGNV